ncbi:hypothetical protein HAV22_23690 [Massilia sp. TW-1]|uniref:Uncharacterized protein n=1 Tax=Telluria antibiotica TaxID=2717319 RepID=A0ABX0PGQ8_9BURK|nr:hypothetical protein [Telluria antibiotica]NIA56631.1 hypothetical protein [Telluria antibiotica]
MDTLIKDKILAVTRQGRTRAESTDWFRVAIGLYYLAGLMTTETIDFKTVDREYNRFIYHTIGAGHTITSILQFMSGRRVLSIVQSERFMAAFGASCTEVPPESIPFLLELNLGVAKNISKLEVDGPLHDWLQAQKVAQKTGSGGDAAEGI